MATARYGTLMPSMPLSSPCIAQAQSAWGVSVWCCAGIKAVWELAQEVDKLCGQGRIRMLDIGGGLSVDYSSDEAPKVILDLLMGLWWRGEDRTVRTHCGHLNLFVCLKAAATCRPNASGTRTQHTHPTEFVCVLPLPLSLSLSVSL